MKTTQSPAVATHTPTPWTAKDSHFIDGEHRVTLVDAKGYVICTLPQSIAHTVLRACNSHAQLVAALGEAWKKMSEAEGVLDNIARRHATGYASRDYDLIESSASEADEARSALRCAIDPIRAAIANLNQ